MMIEIIKNLINKEVSNLKISTYRVLMKNINSIIINNLYFKMSFFIGNPNSHDILSILSKYDKNKNDDFVFDDKLKLIPIKENILFKITNGTFCYIKYDKKYDNSNNNVVTFFIFGIKYKKVKKYLLRKVFKDNRRNKNANLINYKITADKNHAKNNGEDLIVFAESLNMRTMDSIYLENNATNKIKKHIQDFINNEEIYSSRNILYKTGILLEGEPGTGKTSLANAIASEFKIDLVTVDMNDFSYMNINELTQLMNNDDCKFIVLLEDIDCVIYNRDGENIDKDDKKNINKLLQFLDSTSSPNKVIFIATTNYIDRLDDAIKRDGRFDLIVNVGPIKKEKAIEMCKSFGVKDSTSHEEILQSVEDEKGFYNQSKLQNAIIQYLNKDIKIINS